MLKAAALSASGLLALAVLASAADPNDANVSNKPVIEQLREESRTAKKNATELAVMLKSKKADLGKAAEQISAVEKSHEAIRNLMSQLEAETGNWNASKKASFEQARTVADVMAVFVDNKKNIAQGGIDAEERERLRLNAVGAAKRAELLETVLSKL